MFLNLFNILLINILVVKNCIVSKKKIEYQFYNFTINNDLIFFYIIIISHH